MTVRLWRQFALMKFVQSIGLRKNPLDSCLVDSPVLRNGLASALVRKFLWARLAELNACSGTE
jgi:hypothetical protein